MHGGGPGFESPRLHRRRDRRLAHLDKSNGAPPPARGGAPGRPPRAWAGGRPRREEARPRRRRRRDGADGGAGGGAARARGRGARAGPGRAGAGRARPEIGVGIRGRGPRRWAHGGCLGAGGRGRTRPRGETPRGGAGSRRSGGLRMGQPARGDARAPAVTRGAPGELKHLSTRRKREDSPSSGERTGRSPNPRRRTSLSALPSRG